MTDGCEDKSHEALHEGLSVVIPWLVRLLKHWDVHARSAAVSILENLTKHGELQLSIMWTLLTWK
jgi:hypothetical protein